MCEVPVSSRPTGRGRSLHVPHAHAHAHATRCGLSQFIRRSQLIRKLVSSAGGIEEEQPTLDAYKYRYYLVGAVTDRYSLPGTPTPASSAAPFTLGCYRGCPWVALISGSCTYTDEGTTDGFTASAGAGVTDLYANYGTSGTNHLGDTYTSAFLSDGTCTPVTPTAAPIAAPTIGSPPSAVSTSAPPHVLIFQPDDMYQGYSAGWNSPYDPGMGLPVAPSSLTAHIDRIGAEGASFTRAYTAGGMCAPSRIALLTGRYASRGSYAIGVTAASFGTYPTKVLYPHPTSRTPRLTAHPHTPSQHWL